MSWKIACVGDPRAVTEMSSTSTWASGDLISTTADLEKFVKALFSGKVVPPAQLEPMFTVPPVRTYGSDKPATYTSGMSEMVLPGGVVGYGKTGARYGFAAGVGATRDLSRTLVYTVTPPTPRPRDRTGARSAWCWPRSRSEP